MPVSLLLHSVCRVLTGVTVAIGLSWGALAHAQGPDTGSPFVDTPLPFDALKAPPASAFEILMLSIAVFLLVPLVGAAFLGLARLRNMEEGVLKELRLLREALGGSTGDTEGADAELSVTAATERLEGALGEVRASIERLADRSTDATGVASSTDRDRIIEALDRAGKAQVSATRETTERLNSLASALREVASTSAAVSASAPVAGASAGSGSPTGAAEVGVPATLDRVHTRLAALGYTEVEVITPRDEITDELLCSGALMVEARRSGSIHKGKIALENGAVVDVQLKPGHGMFP